MASATKFYDFTPLDKRGKDYPLSQLEGKVILIVNTASKCGFTPQFDGLEELYKSVKEKHPEDFVILGFPCNQFGGQDPGSNDEIQEFCRLNFGVTFPIMSKVDVKGKDAAPLFSWLTTEQRPWLSFLFGTDIKWNFEKFLIGRDGQIKGRWRSPFSPSWIKSSILKELEQKPKV
ncbi:Glutathione peroxidase-like peroxiredoxin HYR1 [Cladobotryum mycophilum]|uniref:Glutathione peroxidase n=1 Tax=Cladobotryum mycophilum TaxID=491253 RepID=A0ABR0SNB4_9HYPO